MPLLCLFCACFSFPSITSDAILTTKHCLSSLAPQQHEYYHIILIITPIYFPSSIRIHTHDSRGLWWWCGVISTIFIVEECAKYHYHPTIHLQLQPMSPWPQRAVIVIASSVSSRWCVKYRSQRQRQEQQSRQPPPLPIGNLCQGTIHQWPNIYVPLSVLFCPKRNGMFSAAYTVIECI